MFFAVVAFAQEIENDSITKLNEVVITTGQYSKQSIKQSVYEVKVIGRKEIEQNAANNLADLLNQTLNVSITPNTFTGKSEVSIMGLDGQYAKVLIDNIPVVNEKGVGNNIDLTLINLDDIQQIEIVEGAMGVQYGSNAVSGIINIITKKSFRKKMKLTTSLQEETVGKEYEWFDKGRHIQSIKFDYNFTKEVFGSISYTRNDFGGFWNNQKGKIYDVADKLRGHAWMPKEQHNPKLLLNYRKNNFSTFYKFEFFNETLDKYNENVDLNINAATDTSDPSAIDRIYTNKRFIHHFNANGKIVKDINYDLSLSYQKQTKDLESYTYRIRSDEKENINNLEYQSRSVIISRATLSNLINTDVVKLQAGYESSLEKGRGSDLSISLSPEVEGVEQKLNTYDIFTSSEFAFSDNFSVRPGFRISFSNLFSNQYIYSLSSKYLFDREIELRAVIGSANRTPNYEELFTYFVHPSHDFFGNKNLTPENGQSGFIHLKKKTSFDNEIRIANKISLGYINIQDKIEFIITGTDPRLTYEYLNIDSHETVSLSNTNTIRYKQFKGNLGITFMGIAQYVGEDQSSDFLFSPRLNAGMMYKSQKLDTSFSIAYKYNGEYEQYIQTTDDSGNVALDKRVTDDYNWLDATVKKSFFDKKIETTVGARNLFDVTTINSTTGGDQHTDAYSINMAYGRSYFIKVAYNLSSSSSNK